MDAMGRQLDIAKHFGVPVVLHLRPDRQDLSGELEQAVFALMNEVIKFWLP